MPPGVGPGTDVLFSTVGRKAEVDEVSDSCSLGAEDLEPPRPEFTIAAATVIAVIEKIQHPVFRGDD